MHAWVLEFLQFLIAYHVVKNSPFKEKKFNPFYWKTHPDQMLHIIYGFSQKIRMDEFSSKTVCVTTRKMKISEKLLDEFSRVNPNFKNADLLTTSSWLNNWLLRFFFNRSFLWCDFQYQTRSRPVQVWF